MRTCVIYIKSVLAVLVSCLAVSCGGGYGGDGMRTAEETAALAAADDSLSANSPRSLDMLKAGLESADDSLTRCDWYLRMMRYAVQRGMPDTLALRWNEVDAYLARQKRTPRVDGMRGMLLNIKGSHYYKLHYEPGMAIRAYSEAYSLLFGSDAEKRLPDVCANLGDAYVSANDMPRAAYWYRRALFLADSLQQPEKDNISLYLGLGRIYLNLGDHDSSLECYRTADRNFSLMPLNMQLYFLTNYGNYYYYTGDYKASLAVFQRMKKLVEDNGMHESYDMYLCLVNMADLYLNLGQYDLARKTLEPAEAFFTKLGDETAVYYAHTIRMGLALKEGDTATVRRLLDSGDSNATIDFNIVNIRQRYLREYYVQRGDYKAAYENLDRSVERNDSLKHNIANMRASEIMMRYEQDTLQLHHTLEMQAKDADIRAVTLWLYVGGLLVVVLVLLFLYGYTFARKRRLQLDMQLMQLRLMNVRQRISPHFIFNVLNNRLARTSPDDAGELMTLAKLIRANLNMSGRDLVSLKEELDFVRFYVSVAGRDLRGGLDFGIDAPSDSVLEEVMVPSMFVQILVENSIKHGLKGREGEKRLRVTVTCDGATCNITVADNGTGFDIRRSDPSSTKTGLKVIRNTINIINRENKRKIRLMVRNVPAPGGGIAGCEVALAVPLGLKSVCVG